MKNIVELKELNKALNEISQPGDQSMSPQVFEIERDLKFLNRYNGGIK